MDKVLEEVEYVKEKLDKHMLALKQCGLEMIKNKAVFLNQLDISHDKFRAMFKDCFILQGEILNLLKEVKANEEQKKATQEQLSL